MIAKLVLGLNLFLGLIAVAGCVFLFFHMKGQLELLKQALDKRQKDDAARARNEVTSTVKRIEDRLNSVVEKLGHVAQSSAVQDLDARVGALERVPRSVAPTPVVVQQPPPSLAATADDIASLWRSANDSPPLNSQSVMQRARAAGLQLREVHAPAPSHAGMPIGFLLQGSDDTVWFLPFAGVSLGQIEAFFEIPASAYLPGAIRVLEAPAVWRNGDIVQRGRVS